MTDVFNIFKLGKVAMIGLKKGEKFVPLAKSLGKPMGVLFASGVIDSAMDDVVNYYTKKLEENNDGGSES